MQFLDFLFQSLTKDDEIIVAAGSERTIDPDQIGLVQFNCKFALTSGLFELVRRVAFVNVVARVFGLSDVTINTVQGERDLWRPLGFESRCWPNNLLFLQIADFSNMFQKGFNCTMLSS